MTLRLGLPKGRMEGGVLSLLGDAGIHVRPGARGYRPDVSLPETEAKLLKPQNVVEMLAAGSRDAGFAGADWVTELQADVIEGCPLAQDRHSSAAVGRADIDHQPGLEALAQTLLEVDELTGHPVAREH